MRTDAYTAEVICQCMGIPSFEHDLHCLNATEAVRLLLKPSFHPEICITIADGAISVASARWMIWRLFEPAPMITDRDVGELSTESFAALLAAFAAVERSRGVPGVMIDGMPMEHLHFQRGALITRIDANAAGSGDLSTYVAHAIETAWASIDNPFCRNALADAGEYVGKNMVRVKEPARKPVVETMVLGPQEDREQLLAALQTRCGKPRN